MDLGHMHVVLKWMYLYVGSVDSRPCVCCFVLLIRYWEIVTVPVSFLFRGPGVARSSPFNLRVCCFVLLNRYWGINERSGGFFTTCVLLCFIKPILGNRYGPGIIP